MSVKCLAQDQNAIAQAIRLKPGRLESSALNETITTVKTKYGDG